MGTVEGRGGYGTSATSAVAGSLLPARRRPPARRSLPEETAPLVETTAEIPVVGGARAGWATGARHERAYSVELPDGTTWYGTSKRLPAPFALRLAVWLLFFLLLVGAAGLAVEHEHPSWLQFLQNTPSNAAAAANSGPGRGGTPTSAADGQAGGGFRLVSEKTGAVTYATGTDSFTIVLSFDHPVWTVVASPAGSKTFLVETVLAPSASPKRIAIQGSASVELSAASESISVTANGHKLGTVTDPKIETLYSFVPSGR